MCHEAVRSEIGADPAALVQGSLAACRQHTSHSVSVDDAGMVNVGLVAVDGMKMGCRRLWPPIVAGSTSTPGRLGRGRPRCGRQRRRVVCATAQLRNCAIDQRHNVILVMHRLVEIKNDDSGNSLLITRGDSARETDKPWRQEQLLGSAISYKRRRKEHLIKAFTPGVWRYLFNHRMLWVYIKMRVSGKRPEV